MRMNSNNKRIYDYLVERTINGEEIPPLTKLAETLEINMKTASSAMIRLDMSGKIKYNHGKVLWVKIPKASANREREIKTTKQQKLFSKEEMKEKYEQAVTDLLTQIIATSKNMASDERVKLMSSILNITDNLENKLFD